MKQIIECVPNISEGRDNNKINAITSELAPIQEEIAKYQSNPNLIQEIIFEGSERARAVARDTMEEVRDAMGITY